MLDRSFEATAPNRKWIADFTYVWTAEGWLYVAAVVDLFSRRVVGWSMNTAMTAQLEDRLYEPYGVREAGGISLGGCQPNQVQAKLRFC